jgi:hypothetical protein
VTIVDEHGRLVPKAVLLAMPLHGDGEPLEREVSGGRAVLEASGSYLLTVRSEGFVGWTAEVEIPGDPVKVRLSPAASLVGGARDETGAPVKGVRLVLEPQDRRAATSVLYGDAEGRFFLEGVVPGSYSLHAEAGGFLPWAREELELPAGRTVRADFTMHRPVELAVVVRGPRRKPVPGAEVFLLEGAPLTGAPVSAGTAVAAEVRTATDGEGRARLAPLPRQQPIRIGFRHPDYAPRSITMSLHEKETRREVDLMPGGSVRLTVADPEGRPIAGARVELSSWGAKGLDLVPEPGPAGADGRIVVESLPVGRYLLEVHAEGFAPVPRDGVVVGRGSPVKLSVEMVPGEAIGGKLLWEDGNGIVGARVTATFKAEGGRRTEETETDAAGEFRFEGLPKGRANLRVAVDGYPLYDLPGVPSGTTDLVIRMTPSGLKRVAR